MHGSGRNGQVVEVSSSLVQVPGATVTAELLP
jgi:hypothetical protein